MKMIDFKAGFVGLIGWTNVGKSTLMNRLTAHKIAITSRTPQTTRNRIIGIMNDETYQIILQDTPGIHRSKMELSRRMIQTALQTMQDSDVVLWVTLPDKSAEFQHAPFATYFKSLKCPLVVVINKVDLVPRDSLLPLIASFHDLVAPAAVVPVSALTGENTERLTQTLLSLIPTGYPLYPPDEFTDKPERFLAAEMIREHIIALTYQEVPHAVAVAVESFRETEQIIRISAIIYVEKQSQKGIIIGKNGSKLKQVGTLARRDLEAFLQKHVDLKLWVKVEKDWRNDIRSLRKFGLIER